MTNGGQVGRRPPGPGEKIKIIQRIQPAPGSNSVKAHSMSDADDDLVLQCRNGNVEAFDALVRKHQQMVHALTFRMTGSAANAEDICEAARQREPDLRPPSALAYVRFAGSPVPIFFACARAINPARTRCGAAGGPAGPPHRSMEINEGGFAATVLSIALLVIMLMLATAGGMALIHLHDEVKVLERQQIKRLNLSETNSVAMATLEVTKSEAK